ncbi:ABC transporter ATP-binding protein [Marinomonas rhodophyticola]|uniref:ABC transporter ATP-binding protein n=1 Tax=Marinomonas rhodophyticola TaxID=2992803 RepID=UPI003D166117
MIAGLEDITDGTLSIDGKVVNHLQPKDRSIAMVFQSYAIFPHMTVRENMAFGLTIAGISKQEKDQQVNEAAKVLQMEHLLERRPSQLSGGQRQRVAIGRAIVRNPKVFLFDETPFQFRCRIAYGHAYGNCQITQKTWCDHDLCDARSSGSHDISGQDSCIKRWRSTTNWQPDGIVSSPCKSLCGRVPRFTIDELC